MGLSSLTSIEWTPAACFLAFQTCFMVSVSVAFITGQTDGIYKREPHVKQISAGRVWEMKSGANHLLWAAGMTGALVAGGAQVMCILQLPPMLAAAYFHYVGGGKPNVIMGVVFMVVGAFFGFVPVPTVPSIDWTPAACYLAFQAAVILLLALKFLSGSMGDVYKFGPHMKDMMSRNGELAFGSHFLGWACGAAAAVIAGGAQDVCILQLPGLIIGTYCHFVSPGGTLFGIADTLIIVASALFGFMR